MTTLVNSLGEMCLVRFGFFHGGRSEGFGLFLLILVLAVVVFWVLARSGNRNAA